MDPQRGRYTGKLHAGEKKPFRNLSNRCVEVLSSRYVVRVVVIVEPIHAARHALVRCVMSGILRGRHGGWARWRVCQEVAGCLRLAHTTGLEDDTVGTNLNTAQVIGRVP
jgi:hypothetical protein